SIAKDGEIFPSQGLTDKRGQYPPVVKPHPGPIRIEDTHNAGFETMEGVIGHRNGLLEALRLVVYSPRANGIHITPVFFGLRADRGIPVYLGGGSHQDPRAFGSC